MSASIIDAMLLVVYMTRGIDIFCQVFKLSNLKVKRLNKIMIPIITNAKCPKVKDASRSERIRYPVRITLLFIICVFTSRVRSKTENIKKYIGMLIIIVIVEYCSMFIVR